MTNLCHYIATALFIFVWSTGNAVAQQEAYIYPKTADYRANKPIKSQLVVERRTKGSILMSGGSDYKIFHLMDEQLNKKLKKEYFLVMQNDYLFVNCIFMGNKWYGLSFYRNDDYIFFVGGSSSLLNSNERMGSSGLLFSGLAGADAAMARYNYVIDLRNKSTHFVEPEYMKSIFGETELYERYKKEKNPYLTEVVLQYLNEHYNRK